MDKKIKVKLLVSRVGLGFSQNAGDIVEVSMDEAARMAKSKPPQCAIGKTKAVRNQAELAIKP